MFEAINTAQTGLQTYRTWLDVVADNVANVNDTTTTGGQAFRARYVEAQSNDAGDGVSVGRITEQAANGQVVHDPSNPLADANGDIRRADVDLTQQMGDLIMAQRAFQANANVVTQAKDAYEAAIGIGKGV